MSFNKTGKVFVVLVIKTRCSCTGVFNKIGIQYVPCKLFLVYFWVATIYYCSFRHCLHLWDIEVTNNCKMISKIMATIIATLTIITTIIVSLTPIVTIFSRILSHYYNLSKIIILTNTTLYLHGIFLLSIQLYLILICSTE